MHQLQWREPDEASLLPLARRLALWMGYPAAVGTSHAGGGIEYFHPGIIPTFRLPAPLLRQAIVFHRQHGDRLCSIASTDGVCAKLFRKNQLVVYYEPCAFVYVKG